MSEVEKLREQLRKAQEENETLRAMIGRKKRQHTYPDDLLAKFPLVIEAAGRKLGIPSARRYCLWDWFSSKLSGIIRSTVFSDTARYSKGKGKTYISVQEMDSEEYELWLAMVERILTDLEDGIDFRREMLGRRTDSGDNPRKTTV